MNNKHLSALATNLLRRFLAKAALVLWIATPNLKVGVSHTCKNQSLLLCKKKSLKKRVDVKGDLTLFLFFSKKMLDFSETHYI